MAKDVNLTSEKWIDMIFEGKNKNYGAYTLRKTSPKRHTFAFLAVLVAIVALLIFVKVYTTIQKNIQEQRQAMTEVAQMTNINLDKPEEIPEEQKIEKFEAPPPVELKTTIQFTAPVIKKDEEVIEDQEVKTQDDLIESKVDISIADVKGTDDETGIDIKELEENKVIVQKDKEPEKEKIFEIVEQPPSFPGGETALYEYLRNNIRYPVIAEENGVQGKVHCQFVVGKDGSLEDIKVLRGVDDSLDKEAIRVIKNMPKWIPGRQGGNAVKVKYILPIHFQIK